MKTLFKLLPLIAILGLSGCNNSKNPTNNETNNNSQTDNNENEKGNTDNNKTDNEEQEIFDGITLNNGVYTIKNTDGLVNFKDVIKGRLKLNNQSRIVDKYYFSFKTVELGADIDLTDVLWDPIDAIDDITTGLVFDGKGHTISNMHISGDNSDNHDSNIKFGTTVFTDEQALGFFGYMGSKVTIKNVTFNSANIEAHEGKWVGTVFGYMPCRAVTLDNIKVTNTTITSSTGKKVGGLIGMVKFEDGASITVKNCEVSDSTFKANTLVGGIAGQLWKYQTDYKNSDKWVIEGCSLKNNTFAAKVDDKNTLSPLCSDEPTLNFDVTSELFENLGNTEEDNTYLINQSF